MHRFWIIGGEFQSLGFDEIESGTERLIGPFGTRDEAERTWRDVSEEHRARCTVRFTIVQENARGGGISLAPSRRNGIATTARSLFRQGRGSAVPRASA